MDYRQNSFMGWQESEDQVWGAGKWHVTAGTPENCNESEIRHDSNNPVVLFVFGRVDRDGELVPARHKPQGWSAPDFSPVVACPVASIHDRATKTRLGQFGIGDKVLAEAQDVLREERNKPQLTSNVVAFESATSPNSQGGHSSHGLNQMAASVPSRHLRQPE